MQAIQPWKSLPPGAVGATGSFQAKVGKTFVHHGLRITALGSGLD